MTAPTRSPLEGQACTAPGRTAAELAAVPAFVGAPKVVAEGVLSSVHPTSAGDGRYPVAWLHIVAPRDATPTATSRCACGRDRSAIGHRRVLALIDDHTAHRDLCPLRAPQEGRAAA